MFRRFRQVLSLASVFCVLLVFDPLAAAGRAQIDGNELDGPPESTGLPPASTPRRQHARPRLPIVFEPEADGTSYRAHIPEGIVYVTPGGLRVDFRSASDPMAPNVPSRLEIRIGAQGTRRLSPMDPTGGHTSYFLGDRPERWRSGVPHYGAIRIEEIAPGIDCVAFGPEGSLRCDFECRPGSNPSLIRLTFSDPIHVAADGPLQIGREGSSFVLKAPFAYQERGSEREPVPCRYEVYSDHECGVVLGRYDSSRRLIIDPTLSTSTPVGGVSHDWFTAVAVDLSGNIYVAGNTMSPDIPTSSGAYQRNLRGRSDVLLAKFDPSCTRLLWMSLLGGSGQEGTWDSDFLKNYDVALAVTPSGVVYLAGSTTSRDFPTTPGAHRELYQGGLYDGFVASLDPDGRVLRYGSYLGGGGADNLYAITLDPDLNVYVGGRVEVGQQTDAAIWKFEPDYRALSWSLLLGGRSSEHISAMNWDHSGVLLATGPTKSVDFPQVNSPGPRSRGDYDAFVVRISPSGDIEYSRILSGRDNDLPLGIFAKDREIYLIGGTNSRDFGEDTHRIGSLAGGYDAFMCRLVPDNEARSYTRLFGGTRSDWGASAIPVAGDRVLVIGSTQSTDFAPIRAAWSERNAGYQDLFLTLFSPDPAHADFSSYFGGSRPDEGCAAVNLLGGQVAIVGNTQSDNFPWSQPVFARASLMDAVLVRMETGTTSEMSLRRIAPRSGGLGAAVTITAWGTGFKAGAECALERGSRRLVGRSVSVDPSGTSLHATFDLSGGEIGSWHVHVRNSDGQESSLEDGFEMEQPTDARFTVRIHGPSIVRANRDYAVTIDITNRGNEDAHLVPLWISVPEHLTAVRRFAVDELPAMDIPGVSSLRVLSDEERAALPQELSLILGKIPAGQTASFGFTTRAQLVRGSATLIRAEAGPPMLDGTALLRTGANDDPLVECISRILTRAIRTVLYLAGGACPERAIFGITRFLTNMQEDGLGIYTLQAFSEGIISVAISCAGAFIPPVRLPLIVVGIGKLIKLKNLREDIHTCREAFHYEDLEEDSEEDSEDEVAELPQRVVGSCDPNDIIGESGFGRDRCVLQGTRLSYAVQFENIHSATAAAQRVVVTVPLDPDMFDLTSVSLRGGGFGDWEFDNPGRTPFVQRVDLQPYWPWMVRIEGSVDPDQKVLQWTFTTIDPVTGGEPDDPLAGFLPPNRTPPEGEGVIFFSVKCKSDLPDGEVISARANIVFDENEAILTPYWTNRIDRIGPSTGLEVASLDRASGQAQLRLLGEDQGSGVRYMQVWMEEGTLPRRSIAEGIVGMEFQYEVAGNVDYSFYTQGVDSLGHVEALRPEPQLTIPVDDGGVPFSREYVAYPNPFMPTKHGTVTLRYAAKAAGRVRVRILDSLGRDAAMLEIPAGQSGEVLTFQWDGRNHRGHLVANGIYFAQVSEEDEARGVIAINLIQ